VFCLLFGLFVLWTGVVTPWNSFRRRNDARHRVVERVATSVAERARASAVRERDAALQKVLMHDLFLREKSLETGREKTKKREEEMEEKEERLAQGWIALNEARHAHEVSLRRGPVLRGGGEDWERELRRRR
jgi:hypothetical protein